MSVEDRHTRRNDRRLWIAYIMIYEVTCAPNSLIQSSNTYKLFLHFLFTQTKTLKLEKEAQKSKARKSRDAFLLMLAENTGIDVSTGWRSAILILQDDSRYVRTVL